MTNPFAQVRCRPGAARDAAGESGLRGIHSRPCSVSGDADRLSGMKVQAGDCVCSFINDFLLNIDGIERNMHHPVLLGLHAIDALSFPSKSPVQALRPGGDRVSTLRFFEMINDAVEAMFGDLLHWPFEVMHPEHRVPTAAIKRSVQGAVPSWRQVGSATHHQGRRRVRAWPLTPVRSQMASLGSRRIRTLVCVGPDGRPSRWPENIRQKLVGLMEGHS